jgi:hypothetical protein
VSDPAIVTSPTQSPTLRRLVDNLGVIVAHLDQPESWQGAQVGNAYVRLEAVDSLVDAGANFREYAVGVHIFGEPQIGDLHDHRWPFAVYPFAKGVPDGARLYEMPWEHGSQRGCLTVCSGCPYAIEQCSVRHAVRSLRPHMSITLTDITDPPSRPNRFSVTVLSPEAVKRALVYTQLALSR